MENVIYCDFGGSNSGEVPGSNTPPICHSEGSEFDSPLLSVTGVNFMDAMSHADIGVARMLLRARSIPPIPQSD